MRSPSQIARLIARLESMVSFLEHMPDLLLHRELNQSLYMQRIQELLILSAEYNAALARLEKISTMFDLRYTDAYRLWCDDINWLTRHYFSAHPRVPLPLNGSRGHDTP